MNLFSSIAICLLFISTSFAQKGSTYYNQSEWLEKAEHYMSSSDYYNATVAFYYANEENPETPEGKNALIKSDSLKLILRNRLISEIQGTWKLKVSGSNWGYTEVKEDSDIDKIIQITNTDITFYEIDNTTQKKKLVKKEKLIFTEKKGNYYYLIYFEYSNSVWSYSLKDNGNLLRISQIGEVSNNWIGEIVCGNSEYYYSKVSN